MKVTKKYAPYQLTREFLDKIEALLVKMHSNRFEYRFHLYFEDTEINTQSKEEFISITNLKKYPDSFSYFIHSYKTITDKYKMEGQKKLFDLTFFSITHEAVVSVEASNVEDVYKVLEEIQKICGLKESLKEEQRVEDRSVFIIHSFDKKGKQYAQAVGKFLTLLDFDVKSGEKFAPEMVKSKIKRRLSSQEIIIAIFSKKEDYTWLNQESGGSIFLDKHVFILKERGFKITKGIFKGHDSISFPPDNIEKAFIQILEGLEEIDYL